jgi:hypothetical protein
LEDAQPLDDPAIYFFDFDSVLLSVFFVSDLSVVFAPSFADDVLELDSEELPEAPFLA